MIVINRPQKYDIGAKLEALDLPGIPRKIFSRTVSCRLLLIVRVEAAILEATAWLNNLQSNVNFSNFAKLIRD